MMKDETYEKLADVQHEIWSSWMKYLFSKCNTGHKRDLTIPGALVDRWQRQINTSYNDLTEAEKQSDREQVDKFLHLIDVT